MFVSRYFDDDDDDDVGKFVVHVMMILSSESSDMHLLSHHVLGLTNTQDTPVPTFPLTLCAAS